MPKLHIFKNEKETCAEFAEWLSELITQTLQQQSRFTIALSGGETPAPLYKILAQDYGSKVDWSKVHIFWGDEKYASYSSDKSNAKQEVKNFLQHLPVPEEQIHLIRTDISPTESAREYEKLLHKYFYNEQNTFDLAILGLGEDGDTLSLFPGNDSNNEKEAWVMTVYNKEEDLFRITLTSPVINNAAVKAFLVTGKKKQEAVEHVLKGKYNPEKYPAQLIQIANKQVHWFLDEGAAGKLIKPTS